MKRGAIVLCGGKSSRLGHPKAMLPFGPERMLQRVVRLVAEVVPPHNIVVVASQGQELPILPPEITITHDRRENRGPLEGIACGFATLSKTVEAAYITGCDTPLLVPAFMESLFALVDDHDIVVPKENGFYHPLAAVYLRRILPWVERQLAGDHLKLNMLFEQCTTREVPCDQFKQSDPSLLSLRNLNTLADYRRALQAAELPFPIDFLSSLGGDDDSSW